MLTLARVNKKIQEKYPKLLLVRGEDYFYFSSDDDALADALLARESSAVYVYRLNHQSLEQWLADADWVMKSLN